MSKPKRSVVVIGAGLLVLTAGLADAGIGNQWGPPVSTVSCSQVLNDYFESLPVNVLDGETIDRIVLLREEEKLARDVYVTMSLIYDLQVFSSTARSEQHHMDLVGKLLVRYGIEDPAAGNGIGEFDDPWVQALYDDLVDWGSEGLIEALRVGVRVEDVDIFHLEYLLGLSEAYDDVSMIVENLYAGSRNHMRSFAAALDKRGAEYEVIYIPDLIAGILASEMETGVVYDENGDVLAECGLAGESNN